MDFNLDGVGSDDITYTDMYRGPCWGALWYAIVMRKREEEEFEAGWKAVW